MFRRHKINFIKISGLVSEVLETSFKINCNDDDDLYEFEIQKPRELQILIGTKVRIYGKLKQSFNFSNSKVLIFPSKIKISNIK